VTDSPASIGVLLLEDDDLDVELIHEQLLQSGLSVDMRRAQTERDFVQELNRSGLRIVLSDFALPEYDGFAALSMAQRLQPDVPFIFVSGAIGEERAIETLQRGATDYVLKSRLTRLPAAVTRALTLADERSRRRRAEAERDALLESERSARAAAEAANRLKDEFLTVASHELRTPLNAILGWATLLTNATQLDVFRRGIGVIQRNALAQSRLIEDILDISRIVTGKLQLRVEPILLGPFIEAAAEAIRPAAHAKGISLTVQVDAPKEVVADSGRLQQVVWNLLSNAVKFTPARGRVALRASQTEEGVVIAVEDDGEGIEPEFLPHVFERFRQGDPSTTRRASGLGLGLSIVRYLVEAHGGTVSVESAGKGQGSKFYVHLPSRASIETPAVLRSAAPSVTEAVEVPPSQPTRLQGVRVLLVEDDQDSRDLIAFILRNSGAEVTPASSAVEALACFGDGRPDIVISDIGMPDMDGYAFIRQLRARPAEAGGKTPAIALTAYTRELDRQAAQAAGFQRHLAKPVNGGLLLRAVAEALATPGVSARAEPT